MQEKIFDLLDFEIFKQRFLDTFGFFSLNVDRYSVNSKKKFVGINWLECNKENDEFSLDEFISLMPFQGNLCVVTFDAKSNPFIVDSLDIRKFVNYYNSNIGDFFDGDLIIINFEKKYFWLKHHENCYTFIDYNKIDEVPISSVIYEKNLKFDIYSLSRIEVDIGLQVDFRVNKKYSKTTENYVKVKILGVASHFKATVSIGENIVNEIVKNISKDWFESIEYTILDKCIDYINSSFEDTSKRISLTNVSVSRLYLFDKFNECQMFTTIGDSL